jgi:hypothetical protein
MGEWRGNERQLTHLTHLILDAALDGCFGAVRVIPGAKAEVASPRFSKMR